MSIRGTSINPVSHIFQLRECPSRTIVAPMNGGVKRQRLAYGPGGAEDEAEAQAKLLEQSSPQALERQKRTDEFTQRGEMLKKQIAELEEIIKDGIKLEPAGGAYDSANEECANAMEGAFKSLLEMKKSEMRFLNAQRETLQQQK